MRDLHSFLSTKSLAEANEKLKKTHVKASCLTWKNKRKKFSSSLNLNQCEVSTPGAYLILLMMLILALAVLQFLRSRARLTEKIVQMLGQTREVQVLRKVKWVNLLQARVLLI